MTKTIKHHFLLSHPKEVVWEYLTKPELMEQWLMKNNFQPIVGHDFEFRTSPIPTLSFDGIFYCKVLEIVPLQKLSYSWKGGSGNGEISLDTVVVWKLVANAKGTDLFLEHSGFGKGEHANFFPGMTEGWLEKAQKVMSLLTTVQDGTARA